MEALWVLAGPDRCYRVPGLQMIVGKNSDLLPESEAYQLAMSDESTGEEFSALCAQVDIVILVVGKATFNKQWLNSIPAHLPKAGFLGSTPMQKRGCS